MDELRHYDEKLYEKPRWIVLNKLDLVPESQRLDLISSLSEELKTDAPIFAVSAATGEGCLPLCQQIMQFLETTSHHAQDHINQ